MNNRLIISVALVLTASTLSFAAPRTRAQMESEAKKALQHPSLHIRKAPVLMQEIAVTSTYGIYGIKDAPGFAVIAADDVAPALLGVSANAYNADNENFMWWLKAMSQVIENAAKKGQRLHIIKPDNYDVPLAVGPLMTTLWDQGTPFNNYCPGSGYNKCITGCVATAMAQVLNYHKTPEHGIGSRTIYYPFQDHNGEAVTALFENHYYDWEHMRDDYRYGNYTTQEANAVAELMRDCGVAANMQYGSSFEGGSGAYSQDAADGLRRYFGFTDAQCKERNYFSDSDWMDMVYTELSENGPLYYGGDDPSPFGGGHAFVLHGYREDGMVYVNWGWSGDSDGYFDISLLNPSGYQFRLNQDMIIGVVGTPLDLLSKDLHLTAPGTLPQLIAEDDMMLVGDLKVSGQVNSTDLDFLRQMAGSDASGQRTKGHLSALDLSEATFVSGGTPYLTLDGRSYTTTSGDLPPFAFYGCRKLKTLVLPQGGVRNYGTGALAYCPNLKEITITPAADAHFVIEDDVVWNTDKTEIIAVLPTRGGTLTVPGGTTQLGDYALAGCAQLSKVVLPSSVTQLGTECFGDCFGLSELRSKHRTVPTLSSDNVFRGVNYANCKLYVLNEMKRLFEAASQWKQFAQYNSIIEYGTTVKVRNAVRDYGSPNPTIGYVIVGDMVEGVPELHCDADELSPAGKYPVTISAGTIVVDESVDFVDGFIIVRKLPLTVSVADAVRHPHEQDPVFELSYSGFVNGDDETCITTPPTVTTTATADSPAGTYQYVVKGGEATNYTFQYDGLGVFTILSSATALHQLVESGEPFDIYSIGGTLLRAGATTLSTLPKGVYIIQGQKVVVK